MNASECQDLYHYAKAMRGDSGSAFRHESLTDRLAAARSAENLVDNAGLDIHFQTSNIKTTDELDEIGADILFKVIDWSKINKVDPNTGKSL